MKKALIGGSLTLALLLAGCGDGADDTAATNAAENAAVAGATPAPQLEQVEAPNGDWSEVVTKTADGWYRMGNPNAPVKLVEYGSLTCPACRAFSESATEPLTQNYVKSGQVSWEFRHLLIHGAPDVALAMLAECQPPSAFFRTIEQIYDNQSDLLDNLEPQEQQQLASVPPEQQLGFVAQAMELDRFFSQRGMPSARFQQCIGDLNAAQQLAERSNAAGVEDEVRGTPTFFINGEHVDAINWQDLEPALKDAIG